LTAPLIAISWRCVYLITLAAISAIFSKVAHRRERDPEDVFHVLRHLASNDLHVQVTPGEERIDDKFSLKS